ncbi:ACP S-malonyltransferase [Prosthecochloris sp. HL-130-GSB]|jgi:[acyl-carrier-protein] S-malonyltransferase|uniref:Malonyl CoA-acyl carrier protein transacylase n=1 Tax=Prosthecochloris aestuarii TaxID=1102 RepID=A0A831SN85_PROAE|nr:ACP S-malonyltransferase [Prosthecochloris sp. HL-130-GSB]ARM30133.1 [acyl-carrier-protein] S-malonyltransferase [Prosthecochloris sp. HL-130-GSB]MBO8091714.1 ACP S-malonyltransferase [Prosthecochloris sp.]HED31677.1 [acyl-carrier-protein] S-malonyltransferase [Prosthecochloris aestuarii]
MKAFVFPGQGSQYCGMAKDIYDEFPQARELMDQADSLLGYSITDIMFSAPEEKLRQTQYTQPAVFLHSMAAAAIIGRNDISMTAGHSLGEYSALCCAGAISFEDALLLVARRGELMQNAGTQNPGTMAAIIGMPDEALEELIEEASAAGTLQPANFNSPGQIVISGSVDAVRKAVELAPSKGARMAKELTVSGAFHSPLMKPAEEKLAEALDSVTIQDAAVPVCMNAVAVPVQGAAEIRKNLVLQLTSPVLWTQSVQRMIQDGITEFMEVGPQKVLQGLIKRIDRSAGIDGIDTALQIRNKRTA